MVCVGKRRALWYDIVAMIKIGIVEDDAKAAENLQKLLDRYAQEKNSTLQVDVFASTEKFIVSNIGTYDLCFFDVQLPGASGLECGRFLREKNKNAIIIFVTNLTGMAQKGYEVRAFDYIVKPVRYPSLRLTMDRACGKISRLRGRDLSVKTADGYILLNSAEVQSIHVARHQLAFRLGNGEEIGAWGALSEYESRLKEFGFFRCNNSCLLNLKYVRGISSKYVELEGEKIKISPAVYDELVAKLSQYTIG